MRTTAMQLGISSWAYPWAVGVPGQPPVAPMDAFALIEEASLLGADLVQIADNLPVEKLTRPDLDRLSAFARERNIGIEIGIAGMTRERLAAHLAIAQQLSANLVRVVIDSPGHEPDEAEIIAILRQALPAFAGSGIQLAVENHDRLPARMLARILDAVDSLAVGICLDTVNSLALLETVDHLLDHLGPRVINLHIKDFALQRIPNRMGFIVEGAAPGRGMLDLPALIGRIRGFGTQPSVILEQWPPAATNLPQTIDRERAWARAGFHLLQSLIREN